MQESILIRTARGAGWVLGWRITTRLLGFVNTLILVRLLVPGDFGLVALGVSFAKAIEGLSEMGVEDALVRAPSAHRVLYDTGFTINVIRGLAGGAIVAASAWPVATFFNEPSLFPVLLALASGSVITALENIGIVDFRRELTFDREFKLLVLPRLASIVVTATCAMIWRSHWALIAGILTMQCLRLVMTYVMHPFRPRLSLQAWQELSSFSLWSWAISLVGLIRDRVDNFVIARFLGTTDVGVFTISLEVAAIPTHEIAAPLGRAALSGFAADRNEGGAAADTYLRILASTVLVGFPAGLGISLVADQVVHLAIGPNWLAAIDMIRVLGIGGIGWLFGIVSGSLLAAHAMMRPLFVMRVISVVIRLAATILCVTWYGLLGAAWAWSIAMTIEHVISVWLVCRKFSVTPGMLWARVWRPLVAGASMTGTLWLLGLGWTALPPDGAGATISVLLAIGVGGTVYLGMLCLVWFLSGRPRGAELDLGSYAWGMIRRRLR